MRESLDFCNPDPREREKTINIVEEGLNVARELGAPVLRVFGDYVPEDFQKDKQFGEQ